MEQQGSDNYLKISTAIQFIHANFKSQPDLDTIAASVNLSPFHFQKIFSEWAGVSPKKFLQFISISYAKELLRGNDANLFNVSVDSGLSSASRLHDMFIKIEGMTPAEYKNGGEGLNINYSFYNSLFGDLLIASTSKGICHLVFYEDQQSALKDLKNKFQNAQYSSSTDEQQKNALLFFDTEKKDLQQIKLHLKGTPFQIKVWESLLKIPAGRLTSYGKLAAQIESPNASRAVGTAIGDNPVAFLIPCHRVIQGTGLLGGYRWGLSRKTAMVGWEAARYNNNDSTFEL